MANEGKHRRPESSGFRIWPGVTLIAICAFLVFLSVYLIAYKTNLIPLPEYVEAFLQNKTQTEETAENRNDGMATLMPQPETEIREIFDPAAEDPAGLLESLNIPKQYYQRMQIVYQQDNLREETVVELYRKDSCWKLIKQRRKDDKMQLYLCDGEKLYRENPFVLADTAVTAAGSFTPENILGIPTLTTLQDWEGLMVSLLEDAKNLQFSCQTEDGLQYMGVIALDTGLLTELRVRKDDTVVLTMYTERFDMAPAGIQQTDFFTIPENGGNDR